MAITEADGFRDDFGENDSCFSFMYNILGPSVVVKRVR